jgi:hypothetical protein
MEREAFR